LVVSENSVRVAKLILDLGRTDVDNVLGSNHFTVLITSSMKGFDSMAELILQYKPKLDLKESMGYTAFHRAVIHGHENIAKLLISKNTNIHSQDIQGKTPVANVVLLGDLEMVKMLSEYGADLSFIDKEGFNLLDNALLKNDIQMINWLKEKGLKTQFNPLQLAILNNDYQKVRFFLHNNKEVDEGFGYSPLWIAVRIKNLKLVELLVKKDADPNRKSSGLSPLELARENLASIKSIYEKLSIPGESDGEEEIALIEQIIYLLENKSRLNMNFQ
jgi:ankyrin repeat protein